MNDILKSMSDYADEVNEAFGRFVQPLRFLAFLSMLLILLHFWGGAYFMSAKIAVGVVILGVFFLRALYLSQGTKVENDADDTDDVPDDSGEIDEEGDFGTEGEDVEEAI